MFSLLYYFGFAGRNHSYITTCLYLWQSEKNKYNGSTSLPLFTVTYKVANKFGQYPKLLNGGFRGWNHQITSVFQYKFSN